MQSLPEFLSAWCIERWVLAPTWGKVLYFCFMIYLSIVLAFGAYMLTLALRED